MLIISTLREILRGGLMYTKESAYQRLSQLVEKFEANQSDYRDSNYNETLTRLDFINPFFEVLNWHINNTNMVAQIRRDVVHEDKVIVNENKKKHTKSPDYSFRINGKILFFVEAKKPFVNIKEDIDPAYQLRRYGWSAKLGISLLTDFEEFSIYDTTKKPSPNDKSSKCRLKYFRHDNYLENFDYIWDLFEKNNVENGSLNKFALDNIDKKGSEAVDNEFLKTLDEFRTRLASNVSKINPDLNSRDINLTVQNTIDRIIFLRIAEDRGIEEYGILENILKDNSSDYYLELYKIFEAADNRYNSGLFDLKKDSLSKSVLIDDKSIKGIIKDLYYPNSPYELSVIPVEILGSAYEQFLGKTITLDKNHKAKIEYKPEVRKAGGVYYTPEYIVDYIVENTVGVAIKNKSPKQIEAIKILDPSCGSGSFLIGAYKYLLDYHYKYYIKNPPSILIKKESPINDDGSLTVNMKKRILVNNIFGVDIDMQAVEVTKLSLMLKCLEGESNMSLVDEMSMFGERALPSMEENIKCGNSLIGTDFYSSSEEFDFGDSETMYKINAFDWQSEYKTIFLNGGFDIVLGNPPYVKYENLDDNTKTYAKGRFCHVGSNFDIFQLFLEKSYSLLKTEGTNGFIFPNLFLKGMLYEKTRKFFYENSFVKVIRDYGDGVFNNVSMPTCIFIYEKENRNNNKILFYKRGNNNFLETIVNQDSFNNQNFIYSSDTLISNKLKSKFKPLSDYILITRGLEIGKNKIIEKDNDVKEILFGENITRYCIKNISYISNKIYKKFKKNEDIFNKEKIIIRETGSTITTVYDNTGLITNRSLYCIRSECVNLKYLSGILNSKLIQYFYENQFKADTDIFPKIRIAQVKQIPIPEPSEEQEKKLVKLVDNIIAVKNKMATIENPLEKEIYERQALGIDASIDAIVYGLYGLSEDEIKIVEGL